ncbi:radical SAM protein [Candidatus Woesearchaeota archaeon]|nr:radical SAM protein [Candidatus Woesearchaeota archaeon]
MVTRQKKKIILNYPPASSVWHIPAGISLITSMLRNRGHEVMQRYGHIIGLENVLRQHGGVSVEEALRIIRDPKSKILDWYAARKTFERVSAAVATKDHFSVQRNNVLYISEHYDGTIDRLLKAIGKREENIFYGYFSGTEIPLAKAMNPDVYAIGIADERQLIPGLILASLVKDELPQTKVIVGGNFWSRVKPAFTHPDFAKLFKHFDAVVYREGFQPMMEFAETLKPESASGTVWKDGNEIKINPQTDRPTAFETLPAPAMDGGARQWSPDSVPSLYTMSNCTMKCGFCAISAGSDTFLQTPRMMSQEKIAETMIQTGEKRFDIFDETFPINRQLALGQELKRRGYEAVWNCYLTVTKDLFGPKRAEELYQAGCRGVQLGLETLSRDTLLREAKSWNHPETYGVILKNLADAGIQTHVFLITGLPGEPLHSSLRWLPFIEDFGEHILTIKAGRYRLTRNQKGRRVQ